MKELKTWKLLMLLVVFSMGVCSCSSDDDDDDDDVSELQAKLEGTWDIYNGVFDIMGQTITIDRNTFYQYKPDNTELWDATLRFSGTTVNGVSYTLHGRQLLIEGMSIYDDVTIIVKSVSSTTLILTETLKSEGYNFSVDLEYRKR